MSLARFARSVVLLAAVAAPAAAQAKLKVYISVDMEGIAGVVSNAQAGGADYEWARPLMLAETNAAIAGAFEAGATDVGAGAWCSGWCARPGCQWTNSAARGSGRLPNCPGTARSAISAGRSLISTSGVTKPFPPPPVRARGTRSARPVRRHAVSSRRRAPRPCT